MLKKLVGISVIVAGVVVGAAPLASAAGPGYVPPRGYELNTRWFKLPWESSRSWDNNADLLSPFGTSDIYCYTYPGATTGPLPMDCYQLDPWQQAHQVMRVPFSQNLHTINPVPTPPGLLPGTLGSS
ncbi:hypothetical protein M2284_001502 [Rhodococcus sp. LBL1]|uniref:Secreted protein n=1 Tax=Prescottella agglutinans TaxID=1644129 RepID=A0ABT6MJ45_9NOCA|nr:hypothetical protein [Prescottella agglutinans]MDH6283925.1 hypothetical protein [Prescottella agglutinans]MDH6677304.1 hypothetical protein [Rhodococcus sp. LBL1]MDH6682402.1 hypothetical protein [Rhodococcus sp. LBL2]